MIRRQHILFLLFILVTLACNKDKRGLKWNSDYSLPLFTTTLTLQNFIADTLLETTNNKVGIIYNTTLYELNKSLLFNIPDTTIKYIFNGIPFGTLPVVKNQELPNPNPIQDFQLPTGQAALSKVVLESGVLSYSLSSKIKEPIVILYNINSATLEGIPLALKIEIPGAKSSLEPAIINGSIDLSKYSIDLTGEKHNSVNRVSTFTVIKMAPTANNIILDATSVVNFSINFNRLKPYYAKGYFGHSFIKIGPSDASFELINKVKNGSFNLSKASCVLDIENGIGVDAKININKISTSNLNNQTTSTLIHKLLNKNLTINRALDNPYQKSHYQIMLDETNSNIKSLIEILPNKVGYEMQAELNPLGNISNGTDFIYSNNLLKARMQLRLPLNTKLNQLVLQDTLRLNLNQEDSAFINYGKLFLFIKNYFGHRIKVNLHTITSQHTLGSLISTDNYVTPNPSNNNEKKLIEIDLPNDVLKQLFSSNKLLLKITLDSNGEYVELNQQSRIEIEASADFNKTIIIK